jgi:ABC-type multidrug transport system fused ATPase/permease subunit
MAMPERQDRSDTTSGKERSLDYWLGVFAVEYRTLMGWSIALSLLSALATFANLQLLRSLALFISEDTAKAATDCGLGWIGLAVSSLAPGCGNEVSIALIVALGLSLLLKGAFDFWAFGAGARLDQQAMHHIEREVLRNLLRQDDDFFVRRSPTEVINRLGSDLQRISGRRRTFAQMVASAASILAIAWVLVDQSWIAASIGLLISILGVLVSQLSLGRMRSVEDEARASDDKVKAAFEDSLQGIPEIQVQNLYSRVIGDFEGLQRPRDQLALRFVDVNRRSILHQQMTFAFGFVGVLLSVIAVTRSGAGGSGLVNPGLIVVLTTALPQLYYNFTELARLLLDFQVAGVSARRLRQYQTPLRPDADTTTARRPTSAAEGIVLRDVRYQFHPDDVVRGGPDGISCRIPPQGLTAIIGAAGSGKSTLVRLILGRQKAVDGDISYGALGHPFADQGSASPFAYLPQRPIVFDTTLRHNLFFAEPNPETAHLGRFTDILTRLGITELIRQKGLDGHPPPTREPARDADIARVRREIAHAASTLGMTLRPFGSGNSSPRQFVIEHLLNCAIDHARFPAHLLSRPAEAILYRFAAESSARDLTRLARVLMQRTAPLLEQAAGPEAYNGVASVMIDPAVWQLRMMALQFIGMAPASRDGDTRSAALLAAIALSTRMDELDYELTEMLQSSQQAARSASTDAIMRQLVEGLAEPLDAMRLNSLLTWRDNLLFAIPDRVNARRTAQVDQLLTERLRGAPLDPLVLEAGLNYGTGRLGGRLSGGQRQLLALARVLISSAGFVFLDEPTAALDPHSRSGVGAALAWEAERRSIVVITHDMQLARSCDQVLFIKDGGLAGQDSWEALAAHNEAFSSWHAAEPGTVA